MRARGVFWRNTQPVAAAAAGSVRNARPDRGERGEFWLRLGLVALVVVVLFALQEALFWPPPLSLTIGSPMEGGVPRDWASAPDDARLPIRFSDGTLIDLEPKARARVVAVSRAGAEIVIESGRAHFAVTPVHSSVPGDSPWRVSLGPFSVEVKCTRFDVEWDPRTDALALDVFEGSVRVSGCQDRHSHTLVAGHGVRGVVQQDGVDAGVCAPCKGSTSAETAARHIDDVALTA